MFPHDDFHDDKPHEECGVFGIFAPGKEVARHTFFAVSYTHLDVYKRQHCDRSRTVDTTTVSPRRSPRSGTSRRSPDTLPVASITTAPRPSGKGDPTPDFTSGFTTRFSDRKNSCFGSACLARSAPGEFIPSVNHGRALPVGARLGGRRGPPARPGRL